MVARNIISPSQAGFTPLKGCEDHVFSLLELIKYNWRSKKPVYALFVDLRRAFDTVNPEALWAVLRHMGVPDAMLNVLRDWSHKRVTTMTRDGFKSDPWPMLMGVGQGDVLSPLLFNAFIESLGRHIAALPGYSGVTVGTGADAVTIKELKYADDICNPAETPQQIQLVLNATIAWCDAWGMSLGLGMKKTEAIAFIPPHHATAPRTLPVLTAKGVPVEWVPEYRYLGYNLRCDLKESGNVTAMASKLSSQWQRYYHSSRLIRLHTPALILQLFKTVVLGSTNYLLALSSPTAAAISAINTATLKAIRTALRLSTSTPNDLVWAEGRAPRGEAIMARERLRFAAKMRSSPFRHFDIAPRIFNALAPSFVPVDNPNINHPHYSLTHRILFLEHQYSTLGVVAPAASFLHRSRDAAVYGRRIGLLHWKNEGLVHCAQYLPLANPLRPPSLPPLAVAAYFNNCYEMEPADAGVNKFTTPLSVRGPGCCGAVLAQLNQLVSARYLPAIFAIRSGLPGMFSAPLAAPGRRYVDYINAAKWAPDCAGSKAARIKAAKDRHRLDSHHSSDPCPLCGDPTADPYHVLIECTHPQVVLSRSQVTDTLPSWLEKFTELALLPRPLRLRLEFLGRCLEIDRRLEIARQLGHRASITDWQSSDGRFTLFHLLAVATWSMRSVSPDLELSHSIADVLTKSEAKNHHSRPLANYWARWAYKSIVGIFTAWNEQYPTLPPLRFVSEGATSGPLDAPCPAPRRSGRQTRKPSRLRDSGDTALVENLPSALDFDDMDDGSSWDGDNE